MTDKPCIHLALKRCLVGNSVFYKCPNCGHNFTIKPLVIEVVYPEAQKDDGHER